MAKIRSKGRSGLYKPKPTGDILNFSPDKRKKETVRKSKKLTLDEHDSELIKLVQENNLWEQKRKQRKKQAAKAIKNKKDAEPKEPEAKKTEIKRAYRSFERAREFVHALNLLNRQEWRHYCLRREEILRKGIPIKPFDIPSKPEVIYQGKGWIGYDDWLGRCAKRIN